MNIGCILCITLMTLFAIMTILFTLAKEKGATFISGFHEYTKEEQACYDQTRLSKDHRNAMAIWTLVMFVGAVLSYVISTYMAIPTVVVWLILFFREVHFDDEKAFEKYRMK